MDLVGELVRLRAPRTADAERLVAIHSDPEVGRFGEPPSLLPPTVERARQAITRRGADSVRWAVERRDDRDLIGSGMLFRLDYRNRNGWMVIELGPPVQWGHGYGTEAIRLMTRFGFRHLGLEKVYIGLYEGNERALRAYRKAGYAVEAELERHHLLHGRLVTEYWLAVYRDHPMYG